MESVIAQIEARQKKPVVVDIKSGDSVKVHQKVREGGKERIQIFEGLIIRTSRQKSLTSNFTVRRIASGVGVEKTFLIHSPNILKIEVVKRSKVRRNYLTYMRKLTGKSARLTGVEFDRTAVNKVAEEAAVQEEAKIKEEQAEAHEAEAAQKAEKEAKEEARVQAALSKHDAAKSGAERSEATSAEAPAKAEDADPAPKT